MATFSTLSSLSAYIKESVKDTLLKDVAEYNSRALKRSKEENVYKAYSPSEYERTYEFLNSNPSVFNDSKSNKNRFVLTTYTETSDAFMPSGHISWASENPMNSAIPFYMEYGNGDSPIYQYGARPYFMDAYTDIEKSLKRNLIMGLRKRGIGSH